MARAQRLEAEAEGDLCAVLKQEAEARRSAVRAAMTDLLHKAQQQGDVPPEMLAAMRRARKAIDGRQRVVLRHRAVTPTGPRLPSPGAACPAQGPRGGAANSVHAVLARWHCGGRAAPAGALAHGAPGALAAACLLPWVRWRSCIASNAAKVPCAPDRRRPSAARLADCSLGTSGRRACVRSASTPRSPLRTPPKPPLA